MWDPGCPSVPQLDGKCNDDLSEHRSGEKETNGALGMRLFDAFDGGVVRCRGSGKAFSKEMPKFKLGYYRGFPDNEKRLPPNTISPRDRRFLVSVAGAKVKACQGNHFRVIAILDLCNLNQ